MTQNRNSRSAEALKPVQRATWQRIARGISVGFISRYDLYIDGDLGKAADMKSSGLWRFVLFSFHSSESTS